MLFLNLGLLFGLLAVGIPILIHLLSRRTAKYSEWGAIRYLVESLDTSRHRVLIEVVLLMEV